MDVLFAAWHYFCLACGCLVLLFSALYLLPIIYLSLFGRSQNLKKKYNATWALVTGGSSGIGKAVVKKLASQVRVSTSPSSPPLCPTRPPNSHRVFRRLSMCASSRYGTT